MFEIFSFNWSTEIASWCIAQYKIRFNCQLRLRIDFNRINGYWNILIQTRALTAFKKKVQTQGKVLVVLLHCVVIKANKYKDHNQSYVVNLEQTFRPERYIATLVLAKHLALLILLLLLVLLLTTISRIAIQTLWTVAYTRPC